MAVRVGIGGWTYAPWRGLFYPPGLPHAKELAYAGERLATIEINGTFYRTPTAKSCADWARQVPDGFVFALKATRYTTHRKVLAEAGESVGIFINSGIVALGEKLGPINWQLAPTKAFDPDDFAAFLGLLPQSHDGVRLRHAVEVRHDSFATPEAVEIARRHKVAMVFADHASYPAIPDVTADFVYARLQQASAEIETGYDAAALEGWRSATVAWEKGEVPGALKPVAPQPKPGKGSPGKGRGKRDVFIYMINGAKERAPAGAVALQALVDAAGKTAKGKG